MRQESVQRLDLDQLTANNPITQINQGDIEYESDRRRYEHSNSEGNVQTS